MSDLFSRWSTLPEGEISADGDSLDICEEDNVPPPPPARAALLLD